MKISKNLAQEIVYNLKGVINQNINLMNNKGYIIASTDPDRINTYHEASKKCVAENRTIYIENRYKYKGSRPGINLPIEFDNEVIGVIGISGGKEVEKYGTIIKKMTEILLKEERIKENQSFEKENTRNFIEALIHNKSENLNYKPDKFDESTKTLAFSKFPYNYKYEKREKLIKYIQINMKFLGIYASFIQDELIILLIGHDKDSSKIMLSDIKKLIKEKVGFKIHIGVSKSFYYCKHANNFYEEAKKAYKWGIYTDKDLTFYEDLDIGRLITSIDSKDLYEFSYRILKNIPDKDLEFYKKLIKLYGFHNGSITKIADSLYMHKNSIQYRLHKIKDYTGYDPRKINDYMVLYFAFISIS